MRDGLSIFIFTFLMVAGLVIEQGNADTKDTSTIVFGSCLRQWDPQPVWGTISSLKPDVFLFMGDNVYSDIGKYRDMEEPERIQKAYEELASSVEYQDFLTSSKVNNTKIYAVWDDHDYGKNDTGASYEHKQVSKKYFLEFFGIDNTVTGPDQPGIYRSEYVELSGIKVQIILLDTRSFRSPLYLHEPTERCPRKNAQINIDDGATFLGDEQWMWLEQELFKPADLRIIASSTQLLPTEQCWEKWANYPNERKRFFDLLKTTKADGVIVVSGDRHLGEISVLPSRYIGYPLYEVTSSGMNSALGIGHYRGAETNSLRATDENVLVDNFGSIQIIRGEDEILLKLQIRDVTGKVIREKIVPLESLKD